MSQMSLFAGGEEILVDDPTGRIAYLPGFVSPAAASLWFPELRDAVDWEAKRRWMYDREVDVPRLTAHYALPPEGAAPGAIREAAERVIEQSGVAFNSVGLNLYRDGRDSVAPHNDHLYEIVEGFPIVLLSLGATRRMTIRAKERAGRVIHLDLEGGSLLTMSYATQLNYTHGVPKTRMPVGERISLAFRVRPATRAKEDARGHYA
jgi:alkylated DNA repair dioxygenase AlkB